METLVLKKDVQQIRTEVKTDIQIMHKAIIKHTKVLISDPIDPMKNEISEFGATQKEQSSRIENRKNIQVYPVKRIQKTQFRPKLKVCWIISTRHTNVLLLQVSGVNGTRRTHKVNRKVFGGLPTLTKSAKYWAHCERTEK